MGFSVGLERKKGEIKTRTKFSWSAWKKEGNILWFVVCRLINLLKRKHIYSWSQASKTCWRPAVSGGWPLLSAMGLWKYVNSRLVKLTAGPTSYSRCFVNHSPGPKRKSFKGNESRAEFSRLFTSKISVICCYVVPSAPHSCSSLWLFGWRKEWLRAALEKDKQLTLGLCFTCMQKLSFSWLTLVFPQT